MADGGFDLSKLAVGDEVGIEHTRENRITYETGTFRSVGIVTEVTDDGCICLEGDEWFGPNGDYLMHARGSRRLAAPTDVATLIETIQTDLEILSRKRHTLTLPALRRLRATLVGLIAGVESPVGEW